MQLRQTLRSEPQLWQVSERPGRPVSLYSVPHFQQCRVSAMRAFYQAGEVLARHSDGFERPPEWC